MTNTDTICTTLQVVIVSAGCDLAGTHTGYMRNTIGVHVIGKIGITPRMYTITDRNRTRMAILLDVVSTLTDLTGGYQRYINGHFHDAPPFT
jgi:hypothetical protein